MPKQAEFRHVSDPFLVWLFSMEVPIQQIGRNFSHLTLVGAIFLHPDTANQPQLLHESLYSLVVEMNPSAVQRCGNASVAISAFVFLIDGDDLAFCNRFR